MLGILLIIVSQNAGDAAYNLRDFRIPDAGAINLFLGSGGDFYLARGYRRDDSTSRRSLSYGLDGVILAEYNLTLSSEKRFINLQISTQPSEHESFYYNVYGRRYEYEKDTNLSIGKSFNAWIHPKIGSSTDAGWYINESQWFLGFSDTVHAGVTVDYSDYWEKWYIRPDYLHLSLFMGGGFGKVRNVAPAAKAWQFLEEIAQPRREDIDALAQLLSTRWKYEMKHWYYEKSFYSDAAALLEERGVTSKLSPFHSMRLREIVLGFPSERLYGNRIFLGAGGRSDSWSYGIGLQANVIGGYPISRIFQLSWKGSGTVLTNDFAHIEQSLTVEPELACYIGERWKFSLGFDGYYWNVPYEYNQYGFGCYIPFVTQFYLEDNVTIQTALTYEYREKQDLGYGYSGKGQKLWFQAALTWRLL